MPYKYKPRLSITDYLRKEFEKSKLVYGNLYTNINLFSYLEDLNKNTPLFVDSARQHFFLKVIDLLRHVDYNDINNEQVFFYSQLKDEDICPLDNEALSKYKHDNLKDIKDNIVMSMINYVNIITDAFVLKDKNYDNLGLSIPIIKETRDKLVELSKYSTANSPNDLYLKLLSLRDSLKLAKKRYCKLEKGDLATGNLTMYGCTLNVDQVSEDLLKLIPIYQAKKFNFSNEEDRARAYKLCDKNYIRISLLVLECLLLLPDAFVHDNKSKLMNKLMNPYDDDYFSRQNEARDNEAMRWISSLPSVEPNCVVQIDHIKKFKHLKNVVNRGDVYNPRLSTFNCLVNIYNVLANSRI